MMEMGYGNRWGLVMRIRTNRIARAQSVCVLRSDAQPLGKLGRLISELSDIDLTANTLQSCDKLTALGMTSQDIADLEFREPYASEIIEYAQAIGGGLDSLAESVRTVVNWHIQDIDRQIEMLKLRKRLLERKVAAFSRLAKALAADEDPKPAI